MSYLEKEIDVMALFESGSDLFLVLLPDLTIHAVSDAYAKATFTKREEIIGRFLFDLYPDNPDNATANAFSNIISSMNFVLNNKTPLPMAVQRYDIRRPDGTYEKRYWLPVNKPVLNAKNEVGYIIHRVEDVTTFIRNLWTTIGNGKIWKGDIRNKAKDGTIFWQDTTIIPFMNEQGKPYKYKAISSDITQRIISFEELKDSEEKYRNMFENSVVSILTTDMRTLKVVEVNDKGVQIFGYKSKKDFIDNYESSVHFVNISDKEESARILKEKGEIKNRVQQMKKLDGTHFWARVFIKLNAEKTLAQVVLIDITQQILSYNELQASEEKYRNLYENTLVAMFTTDINTFKIIEVNDVGVELFGYKSKGDFLRNYDAHDHVVDPSALEKNLETLKGKGEIRSAVQEKKKNGLWNLLNRLIGKKN